MFMSIYVIGGQYNNNTKHQYMHLIIKGKISNPDGEMSIDDKIKQSL